MAVIRTAGELMALASDWAPMLRTGLRLYDAYNYDYATLYRTQPNVRTCVDFLARNIAQLGLHVFQRVGETDRKRLRDHPLAQLLAQPLPPEFKVSRYRLIESLIADLAIYFNAYWVKMQANGRLGLLRVPPTYVTPRGGLAPTGYDVNVSGRLYRYTPDQLVHFRGYNAESCISGLSPLETLRRVLAEEHAMGDYREHFWQNAARMNGVIERPAEAPEWSPDARARFKAEFEALYAGKENSGKTAILEEGMTWKEASFSAQESEYLAGRKLTREECARAYHIPLPMVGILDNATFSNIKEQHKNLYQDALGPWLAMVEQDIELQLLPDLGKAEGVYVEFNIAEKMQGSFEEQTQSLQSAVGRPWMTANEARARMNLPSLDGDADELVTPLNVLVGGQASPRDSAPDGNPTANPPADPPPSADENAPKALKRAADIDPTLPELRDRHEAKWTEALVHHFRRQERAVMSKIPEKALKQGWPLDAFWDAARWNRELEQDIYRLNVATATVWGSYLAAEMGATFDNSVMLEWLQENARIGAEEINSTTRDLIAAAMTAELARDAVQHVFDLAIGVRAPQIATSKVTMASVFGSQEAARQNGLKTKTWKVNSKNPRDAHMALNGETVGIGELFSNGMRWPGDPRGGAENNANCKCSVTFGRRKP